MNTNDFARKRDELLDDFADALAEAENLLKQAGKESGERASDLRGEAERKLRSAQRRLRDFKTGSIETIRAGANATDAYVHENPWPILGVAAAVGVLAGLLLTRR